MAYPQRSLENFRLKCWFRPLRKKKKEEKHALVHSPCFVSVFPPPTGFKLNSWRALQFKVDRVADGLRCFKGRTMNEWGFMFFAQARRVILICLPASPSDSLEETNNLPLPQRLCVPEKATNRNHLWWRGFVCVCESLKKAQLLSLRDVTRNIAVFLGHAASIRLQMFALTRGANVRICICVCVCLSQSFPSASTFCLSQCELLAVQLSSLSALIVSWALCQIGSRRKLLEELRRIY